MEYFKIVLIGLTLGIIFKIGIMDTRIDQSEQVESLGEDITLKTKGEGGAISPVISNRILRESKLRSAKGDYCTDDLPQNNEEQLTKICMPELSVDLGTVRPGVINHSFEIYNKGNYPLLIKYVKANAGDNTASYPKDSIKVSERINLKVKWSAKAKEGRMSRRWVMFTNTIPESVLFTVSANFIK